MKTLALALFLSFLQAVSARPLHIVFITGEYEYHSRETFPALAHNLTRDYDIQTTVLSRPEDEKIQSIPGLEKLEDADLVILMIRRMTLPQDQLGQLKKYFNSGRPLVAMRTASHSFENWKEFDHLVLGGNYGNHRGNNLKTTVTIAPGPIGSPLLDGVSGFVSDGSLYRNTPLQAGVKPLLIGSVKGFPPEPVAWTHDYNGARIFYTSLGHPNDFKEPSFQRLIRNAIEWAVNKPLPKRTGEK